VALAGLASLREPATPLMILVITGQAYREGPARQAKIVECCFRLNL
jgi:hypothetical protein